MAGKIKYFGAVKATIYPDDRVIQLSYTTRGKQPLDTNYPARCVNWAKSALEDYTARGFVISGPGAAPSG